LCDGILMQMIDFFEPTSRCHKMAAGDRCSQPGESAVSLFGVGHDLNRQFIARPDAAKEDILYKWPDMTIRKLTQVTVQPDETAIFVKDGKIAGTLPQGRSTLDGALIPFLGDIVDWASGGNMYRAELYFIGTREFVNLPFGGPIDNIEDPETQLAVGLRVFGDYALAVRDPAALILKLVGTRQASNALITDWAREQILKALRTSVVRKLTAEKWPVLGLAARTADIEAALVTDVQEPLAPYGIRLTRLGNVTISLNPDDEKTLKGLRRDTAYSRLAGSFRDYGVGAALKGIGDGAAAGGNGGAAALGVGMGLGGIVAGIGVGLPPTGGGGGSIGSLEPGSPVAPSANVVMCGSCHAPTAAGAKFCSNCGTAMSQPKAGHCTQCGAAITPNARFCGDCGSALA
jgi:membrane protease subunit (stomatin/prohibitin family)